MSPSSPLIKSGGDLQVTGRTKFRSSIKVFLSAFVQPFRVQGPYMFSRSGTQRTVAADVESPPCACAAALRKLAWLSSSISSTDLTVRASTHTYIDVETPISGRGFVPSA